MSHELILTLLCAFLATGWALEHCLLARRSRRLQIKTEALSRDYGQLAERAVSLQHLLESLQTPPAPADPPPPRFVHLPYRVPLRRVVVDNPTRVYYYNCN